MPFERGGTKPEGEKYFGNGKCKLIANFSATIVTSPRRERREVWREKRKVRNFGKGKCELIANCANFLARESVNSSPILARQWWRHFRLSLSLSVSLSLSLSPKVPHAQYRKRFRASYNFGYHDVMRTSPIPMKSAEVREDRCEQWLTSFAKEFILTLLTIIIL